MKIIEPAHSGWKVFEIPGVEPVFGGPEGKRQAIDYAKTRQRYSRGEIRILDANGNIERTIAFDETHRKLG